MTEKTERRVPVMLMPEFDRLATELRALLKGQPALLKKAKYYIFAARKRNRARVRAK